MSETANKAPAVGTAPADVAADAPLLDIDSVLEAEPEPAPPTPTPTPTVAVIATPPAAPAPAPSAPAPAPAAAAPAPAPAAPEAADPFPDIPQLTAEKLPPQFRKHVDPKAPPMIRGMAAKGLVPLAPADMLHALAMLVHDADNGVAESARKTAAGLPDKIALTALREESLNPRVLQFAAEMMSTKENYLELILLNNTTHDLTVAQIIGKATSARLIEIVANNQLRILREEKVLRAVVTNPASSKATVDSVCDFAVRSGLVLADLPAMIEAHIRIHGKPPFDPKSEEAKKQEVEQPRAEAVLEQFGDEVKKEDAPPMEEGQKLNLTQQIMKMNVSQKIKLATLGNKEARTILLRDTNKLVALAAINSPRITDGEVISMANSKTAIDDVLRTIYMSREWTKIYQIRTALVKNPKVPLGIAMRMLTTLRDQDVKDLSSNKNVPAAIRTQAKKMIDKKNAPAKDEKE